MEAASMDTKRQNSRPRTNRKILMEKQEKELVRKGGNAKGVRTQKMVSFRLDNDLEEWLSKSPNKGRLINQLLFNEKCRQEKGGN